MIELWPRLQQLGVKDAFVRSDNIVEVVGVTQDQLEQLQRECGVPRGLSFVLVEKSVSELHPPQLEASAAGCIEGR